MPNICWSEEKPKKYNVRKEIKLKLDKNYYIHLYGNIQEFP